MTGVVALRTVPPLLLRDLRRLDPGQLAPAGAFRATLGVVLVLGTGVVVGSPSSGVAATIGAFSCGIASFQGTYRTRVQATLATTAAITLSTFVGALAGHVPWLVVGLAGVWAAAAGIVTALGQVATVVGLQAVVSLLVVSQFPMSLRDAALRALLVLLGGLVQTVLVVAVWPLRIYAAERAALAGAFRDLGAYAGRAAAGDRPGVTAPPGTGALTAAADVLGDPHPLTRDAARVGFRALLDLAGRMRVELAALAHTRERLEHASAERHDEIAAVRAILHEAAVTLSDLADDLTAVRRHVRTAPALTPVDESRLPGSAHAAGRALHGQLRAAARIAAGIRTGQAYDVPSDEQRTSAGFPVATPRPMPPLTEPLATLHATLTLRAEAARHALRLGAVVAAAMAASHLLHLTHGYWIAITALVVLRPDFTGTVTRGTARVLGTVLGAAGATALAAELRPGPYVLVALVACCVFGGLLVFRANQAVFSIFLTGYVVFMLALVGLPELQAGPARLADTAAGGLLAMVMYALWPTWEQGRVRERLAQLVEAQAHYAAAVLDAYASRDARRSGPLREAQAAARRARLSAEGSVDRAVDEGGHTAESELAASVVAAMQRHAQAVLALHARVPALGDDELPAGPLAADVRTAATVLAGALRAHGPAGGFPALRDRQVALAKALGDGTMPRRLLAVESDLIVDALDTVEHVLTARPAT